MLSQLLGLVGLQALDEFMQVVVVMRCRHPLRVRQPRTASPQPGAGCESTLPLPGIQSAWSGSAGPNSADQVNVRQIRRHSGGSAAAPRVVSTASFPATAEARRPGGGRSTSVIRSRLPGGPAARTQRSWKRWPGCINTADWLATDRRPRRTAIYIPERRSASFIRIGPLLNT